VRNHELAQRRFRQHNPDSDFLFEPDFPVTEKPAPDADELGLFGTEPAKRKTQGKEEDSIL
jgi:hypothetical protein